MQILDLQLKVMIYNLQLDWGSLPPRWWWRWVIYGVSKRCKILAEGGKWKKDQVVNSLGSFEN